MWCKTHVAVGLIHWHEELGSVRCHHKIMHLAGHVYSQKMYTWHAFHRCRHLWRKRASCTCTAARCRGASGVKTSRPRRSLANMRIFSPPSLPLPLPYPHHHFHAVPALMGWMDSGLLGWGMLHVGVNQIMRTGFANFHKLPRGPWLLPRLEASCVSLSAAR